jgi:hypothetical protein
MKPRARQSGDERGLNVASTGGAIIRTVWLTSGAHKILYFSRIIQTNSNLKMEAPYSTPNIPNFSMWLSWDIMNNFLNCADIQFLTQLELKILEQIQYLNH